VLEINKGKPNCGLTPKLAFWRYRAVKKIWHPKGVFSAIQLFSTHPPFLGEKNKEPGEVFKKP